LIEVKSIYKKFGHLEVLKGIDLDFKNPGIIAVLGPNGSGKTTLIKSVLGMVIPERGKILFNDEDVKGKWKYRSDIGYLPQIAKFPENLTVKELTRFIHTLRGKSESEGELIERFDLKPYMDKRLGTLSGGTKQKVNLLLAFQYDNPVLILDEPTNGLDPVAVIHLKELLEKERQKGKIIIITTHIMNFVEEMADEVIFLLEGVIYFRGTVGELKEKYLESSVERAIARILTNK
jgi:Cu-processing system ATP-binding protein